MYKDYIYEVRGANDPIDGDSVIFETKQDALTYADNYPEAEVYQVEITVDDENNLINKTGEIQVRGAVVDANLADPNIPNSCDADNPDCYDENGNFRLPVNPDDDLEEDFTAEDEYIARKLKQLPDDRYKVVKTKSFKTEEEAVNFAKQQKYDDVLYKQHIIEDGKDKGGLEGAVWIAKSITSPVDNIEEGCDDRRGHDPINRRERVNIDTLEEANTKLTEAINDKQDLAELIRKVVIDNDIDLDDIYTDSFDFQFFGKNEERPEIADIYLDILPENFDSVFKLCLNIIAALPKEYSWQLWQPDGSTDINTIDDLKALANTKDTFDYDDAAISPYNLSIIDPTFEDDEDMSDEEFAESLFSALDAKKKEDAFPHDKLDVNPPHDDVPVVKCKVSDLVTHAEDEKPVKEYPDNLFEDADSYNLDDETIEAVFELCPNVVEFDEPEYYYYNGNDPDAYATYVPANVELNITNLWDNLYTDNPAQVYDYVVKYLKKPAEQITLADIKAIDKKAFAKFLQSEDAVIEAAHEEWTKQLPVEDEPEYVDWRDIDWDDSINEDVDSTFESKINKELLDKLEAKYPEYSIYVAPVDDFLSDRDFDVNIHVNMNDNDADISNYRLGLKDPDKLADTINSVVAERIDLLDKLQASGVAIKDLNTWDAVADLDFTDNVNDINALFREKLKELN